MPSHATQVSETVDQARTNISKTKVNFSETFGPTLLLHSPHTTRSLLCWHRSTPHLHRGARRSREQPPRQAPLSEPFPTVVTAPGGRVSAFNFQTFFFFRFPGGCTRTKSPTTMRPTDCPLLRCSIEERQGPAFVGVYEVYSH
jgi:hypothetical protein